MTPDRAVKASAEASEAAATAKRAATRASDDAHSVRITLRFALVAGACLLVLLVAGGLGVLYIASLEHKLTGLQAKIDKSQSNLIAGCNRGNVLRANDRYVLSFLTQVSAEVGAHATSEQLRSYFNDQMPELEKRLNAPAVAQQDCSAVYSDDGPART